MRWIRVAGALLAVATAASAGLMAVPDAAPWESSLGAAVVVVALVAARLLVTTLAAGWTPGDDEAKQEGSGR